MSSIGQLPNPLPITSVDIGSYTQTKNLDPDLNTEDASLIPDTKGILDVLQSTAPVQVFESYPTSHLTTGTNVVLTGAGVAVGLTVNDPGTTITCTVYDNTAGSGTVIAGPFTLVAGMETSWNAEVSIGITVVLSGACDITFRYMPA